MTHNTARLHFSLFLVLGFLSSCSAIYSNTIGLFDTPGPDRTATAKSIDSQSASISGPAADAPGTTAIQVEKVEQQKDRSDVEILWAVPDEALEQYVIRYGYTREKLDFELRLRTAQIEKVNDPKHGEVYRYILENIPKDRELFVSLGGEKNGVLSAPSEVMTLSSPPAE
ncbi:MAG: hypothetical protein K1X83_09575 [Oligoflexia bacterium]|nr:hypothetical protein [Oligoflexia bacterium]